MGHQAKLVRELISAWRLVRLLHRSAMVSMSLSRFGTSVLTIGSSTKRPERLGGLQFGTVGRQVDQPDAVRHGEVGQGVPAGVVEQQHDALLGTGADRACEGLEQAGEERLGHAVSDRYHTVSPVAGPTKAVT